MSTLKNNYQNNFLKYQGINSRPTYFFLRYDQKEVLKDAFDQNARFGRK